MACVQPVAIRRAEFWMVLKLLDIGDGCGRSPDWGGVVYDGAYDGVVGERNGRFVLSPCPTGKGFEDV